jgi:hypothetical protein
VNLPEHLLLACNTVLLFFNEPVLDALHLSPDRVQVVIVVLDAVFSFFIDHGLQLVPARDECVLEFAYIL